MRRISSIFIFASVVALLTMFNNCGRVGFDAKRWASFDASSTAACESDLKAVYGTTYHPYLMNKCATCHGSAHGSSDLNTSYSAFMAKGETLIDYQATHAHGGNSLGPQEQPYIDAIKPTWDAGQARYTACLTQSPDPGGANQLKTTPKVIPNIEDTRVNRNNWKTVTWDLEREVLPASDQGKFLLSFKIEARYAISAGAVVGIEFRNPSMKLKTAGSAIQVSGLDVWLDGGLASDVTTYSAVDVSIGTTTDTPLAPGASVAFAYKTSASAQTEVAFQFLNIQAMNPTPTPTPTPTPPPGPTPTPPSMVTFTDLTSTNVNLNVFRQSCFSCHSGANIRGGLDISVYSQAKGEAANIKTRMNDAANPMPPSGVLAPAKRDLINLWISGGTLQ